MEIGGLISKIIGLYQLVLIIRVALTWIPHDVHHPVVVFLHRITEPILAPVRRVIPSIGGIDVSAVIVIFVLWYIQGLFR
jgi:YggT family protein